MSRVSRTKTPQEQIVCSLLHKNGFRFRKNVKKLSGSPDIVLSKYKTAIFVHGCFWHNHSCKAGRIPISNNSFWTKKLRDNKIRDKKKSKELKKLGWQVIEIWQCDLKTENKKKLFDKLFKKLIASNEN